MGQFLRDLRFGARSLSRSPGFSAVALATIALGIGANTAIFSVVDAVLLRPLPFPGADRLVAVAQNQPSLGVTGNGVSYPNFADWSTRSRSFDELAAIRMHDYTLTGHGDPLLVTAGTVTSNLFRMLEDTPILGRTLAAIDDDPGPRRSRCSANGSGARALRPIPRSSASRSFSTRSPSWSWASCRRDSRRRPSRRGSSSG